MRKRRWVRDTGKAWADRIANPATTRISQGSRGLTVVVGRIWSVFFTANEETALNPDPFDPVATNSSGWRQPACSVRAQGRLQASTAEHRLDTPHLRHRQQVRNGLSPGGGSLERTRL